eukprot:6192293-Pleurochrysis_carterae.AAC.1
MAFYATGRAACQIGRDPDARERTADTEIDTRQRCPRSGRPEGEQNVRCDKSQERKEEEVSNTYRKGATGVGEPVLRLGACGCARTRASESARTGERAIVSEGGMRSLARTSHRTESAHRRTQRQTRTRLLSHERARALARARTPILTHSCTHTRTHTRTRAGVRRMPGSPAAHRRAAASRRST